MFLFCLESSHAKGMGHLFRVINLYRQLREKGSESAIALLNSDLASQKWLDKVAIPYVSVDSVKDSEWELSLIHRFCPTVWINDRLNTDVAHAVRIKSAGVKLVTFDDAGSGAALADLHVAALADVRSELPAGNKTLVGVEYLIFPPEISQLRRVRRQKKRWIVSLGGSDTHGATLSVAEWLNTRGITATILLGPAFTHDRELSSLDSQNLTIKRGVPSLLSEMADHDFAITGGGLTAFEAAVLGLPTAIVANEKWEVLHAIYLQSLGCSIYVGTHDQMNLELLNNEMNYEGMSNAAMNAFLPNGAIRVVESLLELHETKE